MATQNLIKAKLNVFDFHTKTKFAVKKKCSISIYESVKSKEEQTKKVARYAV
jgi:hypothetical protein